MEYIEYIMDTMENLWNNTQSFHKIHGKYEISEEGPLNSWLRWGESMRTLSSQELVLTWDAYRTLASKKDHLNTASMDTSPRY